ncbi:MAG: amidase [Betaproteobacteria bacterium]|jgi:amidase|nr:amidase [Betaproteobacteria bacterium]NBP45237.1 amidase [Betaproteobacteria bacterium]
MQSTRQATRAYMPYPDAPVAHAPQGPLSGLTFAVKDLMDVAGYPTSNGQPLMLARSGIKTRHADVVQRLLDAGAAFAGKTITDELAFSMNGRNAHFGAPINGAAPDRITGGSSCGSASAVSHGLVDMALGTDTGGSIRAPANHCGLWGLRPTHGRISLKGAWDLAPSFDTLGWFTRDVTTFARVADVLLGPDTVTLPAQLKWVKPQACWDLLDATAVASLAPVFERIERVMGPLHNATDCAMDFDALYWAFRYIQGQEAWQVDGEFIDQYHPPLGTDIAQRFDWSRTVTAQQADDSRKLRQAFTAQLRNWLGHDTVWVMPTMPDIAPRIDEPAQALEGYRNNAIRLLCLSGLSGFPQLHLPLAQRLGAPFGLSLLGPPGSDRRLIQLAQDLMAKA